MGVQESAASYAAFGESRADRVKRIEGVVTLVDAGSPLPFSNRAVLERPIDDVRSTLRIATETGTPVVTRGAGTGLAGGAIASTGEIVLSTLAMNRILEVSADDELAVIEPGIINADLNSALAKHGLWFAPDPASKAISTVGGNIATNAGGLLCAKYGVTRLVHYEGFETREGARLRERRLKEWQRKWKLELIERHNPDWEDLFTPECILDHPYPETG